TDLVQFVERDERVTVPRFRYARTLEQRTQRLPVVQSNRELLETEFRQHLADRAEQFGFDDRRCRADRVDVALVELAESSFCGPVGAPHRLNLVSLEELRQRRLIFGDD